MAQAAYTLRYSLEDYLQVEREAETKSEYIGGLVYAMAGATEVHNTIATTFCTAIDNHLPNECRVWQSDMKVVGHYAGDDFAYYPDIMASCEPNTGDDPCVRTNPLLIVEVLSPSTQRFDLHEKLTNYTHIPSLMEYVAVAQDQALLRVFRRSQDWALEVLTLHDDVYLESIELTLPVAQIYRRVRGELDLDE